MKGDIRIRVEVDETTNQEKVGGSTRRSCIKTSLHLTTQHPRMSCLVGACIEVNILFLWRENRCGIAISPLGDGTAEGWLNVGLEEGDGVP